MELLLFIAASALTIIPMWRLCERAGLKPAWALVCIIPLGLIALLWYLAFGRDGRV
jgi:heme/copper-type cytochrome/quinol oxidase subunit 4